MKKLIIVLLLYQFIGLNANDCEYIRQNFCNETTSNWIIPICNNFTELNESLHNCSYNFITTIENSTPIALLLTLEHSSRLINTSHCIFHLDEQCPCFTLKYDENCNNSVTTFILVIILGLLALLLTMIIALRKYRNKSSNLQSSTSNSDDKICPTKQHFLVLPPPRSLTQDDLEHISSLPRQEILLIYYPDNPRFKELNRRFKEWLCSLNLRDVHDVFDDLADNLTVEEWAQRHLYKVEKRFILVCSRMAFNVLTNVDVDNSSKQVQLLSLVLNYLQSKMAGNYRNLICVRFEDIRICDRVKYSSEAFNIVPGTEYVLPQHLEDVYRWIHPRSPKPEAWSVEQNPLVRELNKAIRNYQNHEENIFTVSFSS